MEVIIIDEENCLFTNNISKELIREFIIDLFEYNNIEFNKNNKLEYFIDNIYKKNKIMDIRSIFEIIQVENCKFI